mgnify:CR=1 FL=1
MFKIYKRATPRNVQPAVFGTIVTTQGKANPIRHYRRGYPLDCPTDENGCMTCTNVTNTQVFKAGYDVDCNSKECHAATTAVRRVRNSGNTKTNSTMTNSEYMKKKRMTYADKKNLFSNENTATTHEYDCGDLAGCTNKTCKTIYKPRNKYFNKDGGADSSAYMHKVKFNAIQSTANSFEKQYGSAHAMAHAYSGRSQAPFILGFKQNKVSCSDMINRGNKSVC